MKSSLPLPDNKKLHVTYRVEPGCLGPDGKDHISQFCKFAQGEFKAVYSDYISWNIVPRNDKTLPEMQHQLLDKNLSDTQVDKYLALFDNSLDELEGQLADKIATLVDDFLNR